MQRYTYRANNSGGYWWLSRENWEALENMGWTVNWGENYYCGSTYSWNKPPSYPMSKCEDVKKCNGHRRFNSPKDMKEDDLYMGAYATTASKEFLSMQCAIAEFEFATGMNYEDEGCPCCGQPHYISEGT